MEILLQVANSLLLLFLIVWLYLKTGYGFKRVSIPLLFFTFSIILGLFGYIFIFAGLTKYGDEFVVSSRPVLMQLGTFLAISFCFLGIRLSGKSEYLSALSKSSGGKNDGFVPALLLFSFFCLVFAIYLSKIPGVPLFAMMASKGAAELAKLRSDSTAVFGGKAHYYLSFIQGGIPFLSYYFLARFFQKKTKGSLFMMLASAAVGLFAVSFSTAKAPIVFYLGTMGIVAIVARGVELRASHYLGLGLAAATIVLIMFAGFIGFDRLDEVFYHMFNRLVAGQIRPLYYYLEIFPSQQDYLLGQSFGVPLSISPFSSHYNLSIEVMNYVHPDTYTDRVGRANTIFWAEIFANFGPWLVPVFSVFLGYLMGKTQRVLAGVASPMKVAMFGFFSYLFAQLAITGVSIISPFNTKIIVVCFSALLITSFMKYGQWRELAVLRNSQASRS